MGTNVNQNEPSKGLGDSIAKITKALKLDKVADAVAHLAGLPNGDCGCDERREYLNKLFPYGTKRRFKVLRGFNMNGEDYEQNTIITLTSKDPLHEHIIMLVRDKFVEEI